LDPALDALIARIEDRAARYGVPVVRGAALARQRPLSALQRRAGKHDLQVAGQCGCLRLPAAGRIHGRQSARPRLGTNGLTFDANDSLVMADHGNRQVARLNEANFTKTTLADRYQGNRLNSPNDLVYRSNGDLYFTDPPYGLKG
jgi:hypothetical protein